MPSDYEKIKNRLEKILPKKRYIHSLGVADEARRLAAIYGADEDKAYLAGLLHDNAKAYPIEKQIALCADYGVKLDDALLQCPPVIHGFLGRAIAKKDYKIKDKGILNAIRYHTVGRAGMSLLEKIIYIADMTEPSRDFDGVEDLRRQVDADLDEALIMCIREQLAVQCGRRSTIHPNMICMWNDLILNKGERIWKMKDCKL
ncbi:MAG: bis(5'-nucleosyl)-tetraphosphatase (symmetrical) YqeK [Firmicutes bacterium]|nr:bis(5'-nucleosyl)-tetraphosphatase (symmetrical) YqeK [Bacillota bacterium]